MSLGDARVSVSSGSQLTQHAKGACMSSAGPTSEVGSPQALLGQDAGLQNSPRGAVGETATATADAVDSARPQTPVHEACCAVKDELDHEDGSSTCSECSGSQHHATPSCDGRDDAIAAWLADHGQVTLADVEEAVTPAKRFDPELSSPSHGSLDSWHGLDAAPQPPTAAAPGHAHAFPLVVQPFDQARAGAPHGAVQALNSRLQHGVLDAHARQRAMRRDMRAVTSERQISHALAPAENAAVNVPFPGPPPDPGNAEAPSEQAGAAPAAQTGARPTKMMRLGPPVQGAQHTIPAACGKGRIRIARMVF